MTSQAYVLPTGGGLYSPQATLDAALQNWSGKFAQIEATSQARECLMHPEYVCNGYHPTGYYTHTAQYVPVRYRYSKRGQWRFNTLIFGACREIIPCTSDGEITGDPLSC